MRDFLFFLGLSFSISLVHALVQETNLGLNPDEPNLSTLEEASSLDFLIEDNYPLSQELSSLNDAATSDELISVDASCLQDEHQPTRKLRVRGKTRMCPPRKPRPGFSKPSSHPTHKNLPGPQRTTEDRPLFPLQDNLKSVL